MLRLQAIVPLALYLGGAHASSDLTGSSPALPTLAAMKALGAGPPEVTTAPQPNERAVKRAQGANTCGYVSGDPSNHVTCQADGSECLYESDASAVGCCATTDCDIWTACIDRTDSDIWSTADADRTRYCSETASPYCAVYAYEDSVWTGYTMILCDSEPTSYPFYYTASGADADDVSSFILDDPSDTGDSTKTTGKSAESTDTPKGDDNDDDDDDNDDGGGGAPVGAIVGGVVGGVAAIGLVGLAAWLLLRRRKSNDAAPAAAAAAPTNQPPMAGAQYPNQPPPGGPGAPNQMYSGVPSMYIPPPGQGQPGYPPMEPGVAPIAGGYYAPPNDNQGGMAKTPLSPMSTTPSQFTPTDPSAYNPSVMAPPQSTSPANTAHTPPPPSYGGYAQAGQQQQQQHQQGGGAPIELPTGRPDGELRELA